MSVEDTTMTAASPLSDVERRLFRKSLLIRETEEALLRLYAEGELHGTVHTCIGQELSGAIVCEFLQPEDSIFSNHRCHGHFLSRVGDVTGLIAEILGKELGVCGGRGGSQHLCKDGFFSNGIQGGIVPVAAGLAFARKLLDSGSISVVFIGDGTLGEGVLYEVLNIASKWSLPLLIVLENNFYAQSTHHSETLAGDICERARAFGVRSVKADTWNWRGLFAAAEDLAGYTRRQSRPSLLQVDTYRLKAHSKGDDNRDIHEIEHFRSIDPINVALREREAELAPDLAEVRETVEQAIAAARSARYPSPTSAARAPRAPSFSPVPASRAAPLRMSRAINDAFVEIMERDPRILFIGEDVKSPYGGAFKISDGLSDRFPGRVFNTPISESAIVGIGCGVAMAGYRPFVEIMFGDFLTLAFDQILNHAAKFRYMYNEQVRVPLVIRTPMGAGRGYGPTHSQTLEKHFMGVPGLTVLAINNLIDPKLVYRALAEHQGDPVLLIENKVLYTKHVRSDAPAGFERMMSDEPFPAVVVAPRSTRIDVTIFGYGGLGDVLVDVADKLFEEHDVVAQIICPVQVFPFSVLPYAELVSRSKLAVTVEEGQGFAGFGAEVVAQLAELKGPSLPKVARIGPPSATIPASKPLEAQMFPGIDSIVERILELLTSSTGTARSMSRSSSPAEESSCR
ncbi:thiamine pyrophosphate-dependent enzyme [Sorangium sp. So ce834]|uniref:dehydrogenase E1 component subunit alpha/beta n=1 Tax=Sorangium sp. So ce834 TaxID=3133321 RepID=UPI003F61F7A4